MDGAAHSAAIATSISVGTSLLAGVLSSWVAMRSSKGAAGHRDPAVSILFGIAALLMVFIVVASALIFASGMAFVGLLKAALLLTAAFAVAGTAFGLVRGLRSGSAIKTLGA